MKIITALILCFVAVSTYAQTPPHMQLSLQAAIDTGLKNRYDIQADQYSVSLAENTIDRKKKEWLPSISANGDIRYNAQLQATYIPSGFVGLTKPELLALGAKSNAIFGLDLDQTIYRPGINMDIKIAKNELASQKEKNRQTAIDIKMRIAGAYLDVLLKELQYTIATHDENRFRDYTELAKGKYEHGALLENDYRQTTLDYENAKVQTEKTRQNYDLATDKLKYQMNISTGTAITLSDTLGSENLSPGTITPSGPLPRTEITLLQLQQQSNKLELQKARQTTLPSLSMIANYSQQFQYDNFSFNQGQWWSPFSYIGLKINIPLTANIKNKNDQREYQFKIQQTDLAIRQKTSDIDYEVRKASTELHNAFSNMQVTKNNYELSVTIYQNQKQQYQLGAFTYGNLLDTERSLNTAEQNYIKAVYDYLMARLDYQYATGRL